jgi:hypothetical protein
LRAEVVAWEMQITHAHDGAGGGVVAQPVGAAVRQVDGVAAEEGAQHDLGGVLPTGMAWCMLAAEPGSAGLMARSEGAISMVAMVVPS